MNRACWFATNRRRHSIPKTASGFWNCCGTWPCSRIDRSSSSRTTIAFSTSATGLLTWTMGTSSASRPINIRKPVKSGVNRSEVTAMLFVTSVLPAAGGATAPPRGPSSAEEVPVRSAAKPQAETGARKESTTNGCAQEAIVRVDVREIYSARRGGPAVVVRGKARVRHAQSRCACGASDSAAPRRRS